VLYRVLAFGVAGVHFAFVLYVAVGGLVALRWPWTVVLHAAAVAWGVLVLAASVRCPLTSAEDWLRERGGLARLPGGFIDRYVEGVLYPARFTPLVQALVAVLVVGCWFALFARSRTPVG
jgi:hypothetical protein